MTLDQELIDNAALGNVDKVRDLLRRGANVNAKDTWGNTALMFASLNGHLEVVRALLDHDGVDVNIKGIDGNTALIWASRHGNLEVVHALLNHTGVDVNIKDYGGKTALDHARNLKKDDVARLLEEHMEPEKHRKEKERTPHKKPEDETPASEEKRPSSTDVELEKDQKLLLHVMNTSSADPVELSLEYIKRCITNRKLGSGAFGHVFLAQDSRLPKKFVVKTITLSERSDGGGPNEDNLKIFQNELSTLKQSRHPNILDLYGYNFKGGAGEQFLVYEFTANGSLDGFLKDDDMRARLSAATRLTIMYEVARAVHFLHTGGAGLTVSHRDIKSANIYLTKNFTPRLIDCGLAKFVEDKRSAIPSETTQQTGVTEIPAIGSIGYMCPEYASKMTHKIKCDYTPAYDVYSIGVVMAELIVGRLNVDPAYVFESYVVNGETPIVDGWKLLKIDADLQVDWNAETLELICKTVIGCITPSSEGRLSTGVLLPRLHRAITLDAGETDVRLLGGGIDDDVIAMLSPIKSSERDSAITFNAGDNYVLRGEALSNLANNRSLINDGQVLELVDNLLVSARPTNSREGSSDPDGAGHGVLCFNCNERLFVVKCERESHPICADCIDAEVGKAPASTADDFELSCMIDCCSSDPFTFNDLKRHINGNVWQSHLNKMVLQRINEFNESLKDNKQRFDKLSSAIDHCLKALSLNNAHLEQFNVCPTLVVIKPSAADRSKNLKTWFTNTGKQKYQVTFYCERSGDQGHDPFEISVDKQWIVVVVPLLQIAINIAAAWDPLKVSPAVTKEFPIKQHSEEMKDLIKALADEKNHDKKQTLEGKALKAMAKMAKEHESKWRTKMETKLLENGRTIWVKKVDDVSHDDDMEICA